MMAGYDGLIQPIVVRRTGTHEQMVEAVARASVRAYLLDPENPAWKPWLAASFGKTVRRARPVEVEKAREFFVASAKVGDAEAFACLPVAKDDMPAPIRKMQVSGTVAERTGWANRASTSGPTLKVNSGAAMTTGKTCAQVAHALFAWVLQRTEGELDSWIANGMQFTISEAAPDRFAALTKSADIVVEDAGHTEVDPGTATVLVSRWDPSTPSARMHP